MNDTPAIWPKKIYFCETLKQLTDAFTRLLTHNPNDRWYYRGQADAKWELKASLERFESKIPRRELESQILSDFKRHAQSLSDRLPEYSDTPSWLSLMRHHNVPTRLLDWTDSAYIALFFACEEETKDSSNAAVWALNHSMISKEAKTIARWALPKILKDDRMELDLSDRMHFDELALYRFDTDTDVGFVEWLLPRVSNARMSFQQGIFSINCNHKIDFQDSLRKMMRGEKRQWAYKFEFPCDLRKEILRHLYERNIHPFTLFPDLDGMGRLLKLKSSLSWYS